MCGIFGFSGFRDSELLHRMAWRLRHRGPDGEGFLEQGEFSFGNRRLAIIDLDTGDQPIFNEDRTLAIVQNGEIYNYVELRKQLKERGHRFATHTDTEVVLHGFEEWGEDVVHHLEGMFAFAIHDLRSGETLLARDPCGQKPLFYWSGQGSFLFASAIKALLECESVPRRARLDALDAWLCLRYVPEPATMFEDIHTLPAGHLLRLHPGGGFEIERYWSVTLSDGSAYRSDDDYLEELQATFDQAMARTMRSDVPVASYLSAGVDSSLIAKVARDLNTELHTWSIGFHSNIDETRDAAETAARIGSQHHEIYLEPQDFALLPRVIWQMDVPVGDAIILAFDRLAAACAQDFKVVLSGEGADEMFAGYPFHKILPLAHRYSRLMPGLLHEALVMPLLRAAPVGLLDRVFPFPAYLGKQGKRRVVDFLGGYRDRSLRQNYVWLKTLWGEEDRRNLYSADMRHRASTDWIPADGEPRGHFLDRLLAMQYDAWMQDWAIIRQERNTMAHSLELRLPFLDKQLIELAFRMPPHLKARGNRDKIVERRLAERLLPPEVVRRAKVPFYLPMDYFVANPEIQKLIDLTLNPTQVAARGYFDPKYVRRLVDDMHTRDFLVQKQVMSLVILELWHMIHIDQSLTPTP